MDQVTVISLFVLLFALFLPVLARMLRSHPRWFSASRFLILGVYILANLYETLLFRPVKRKPKAKWTLFWSYRKSVSLPDGLMGLLNGSVEILRPDLLEEIILNILLYIPLGYLLPFTFSRLKGWHVIAISFVCSVLTEVSQYYFKIGTFEFDDMLNNTAGSIIGLLIYYFIIQRSRKMPH